MLSAEQREIRALAREFAGGEIRPHSARWDAEGGLDDEIFGSLAELGFLGLLVPEEHGGLGLDLVTYLLILEELAWGDAAVALSVAIHNGPVVGILMTHGSADQKSTWLPRLAAGDAVGAFALSEEDAGSDAAAVACRARRRNGSWVLSGRKKWVTNGRRAGMVLVFARTGEGEHDIGCFLVDPSTSGYAVAGRATTMGLRASETVHVELQEVAADCVGESDQGFRYAMEALDLGRAGVAAQALGIGRAAMEHAIRYAREREQFGQPLAGFGAIQEKLANMAGRLAPARALTRAVAVELDARRRGEDPDPDDGGADRPVARAALAKIAASEAATWVADEAVQIFGGYGYMRDYPVEKLMRDAKGTEIYEGTSEVLRHVVAREILRDARD
ncbi:MAG: acyl-CoA dehydrogenase family protein [Gemmatimonadota bacterium]|jgi:alkylation response protein AidB-like acyl-CoA dehydrogenase